MTPARQTSRVVVPARDPELVASVFCDILWTLMFPICTPNDVFFPLAQFFSSKEKEIGKG